jgi:hypothetical protein
MVRRSLSGYGHCRCSPRLSHGTDAVQSGQRSMREIDRKRLTPLLEELAALHHDPIEGR